MKSIQLLAIPLALAICVSTSLGQETENKDDKILAKAGKMLHGTWTGDADKTAEEIKKMEDLDLDESMMEMILEQVVTIEANFKDGTYEVVIGDREMSGDWKVKKVKRKDKTRILTAFFAPDEDSEGEDKNFEIHFMGKTHMKMIDLDDGGPPIVLKRQVKDKNDK